MAELCEVCGRGYSEDEGHLTGERGDAACYRLGYEREKAAREAAEKDRDTWLASYQDHFRRLEAAIAEEREGALEQAAQAADHLSREYDISDAEDCARVVALCASRIRALAGGNAAKPPSSSSLSKDSK